MATDAPKVKLIRYDLGKGDYLLGVPTVNGFNLSGYIAGEHIQFEEKDLNAVKEKISNYSSEANKIHTSKANRFKEVELLMKENELEKFAQTDGDHKTDLNWVKD
jgi:hypothetical protein